MSTSTALGVVRGALMWILSVGEVEHLLQGDDDRLGKRLSLGEPRRDGGLVRRGRGERLGCELAPGLERECPVRAKLVEDEAVAFRPADGSDVREVLR